MRKATWLMLGLALASGTTDASAQDNKISRPQPGYIGIRFQVHDWIISRDADAKSDASVVVEDVSKDSPAEKAGLRPGDEILRINGMSVANGKFSAVARTLTEGDTVRLRIKRADSERDYTLIAAARPSHYGVLPGTIVFSADSVLGLTRMYLDSARIHLDSLKLPRIMITPGDSAFDFRIERFRSFPADTLIFGRDSTWLKEFRGRVRIAPGGETFRLWDGELGPGVVFQSMELGTRAIAGAEFTELDPAMKTYFGTDRGLLTLRVAPETPAARAGLVPGDIVQKANGRETNSVAALRSQLFDDDGTLELEVLRKGETKTLEIKTSRKRANE